MWRESTLLQFRVPFPICAKKNAWARAQERSRLPAAEATEWSPTGQRWRPGMRLPQRGRHRRAARVQLSFAETFSTAACVVAAHAEVPDARNGGPSFPSAPKALQERGRARGSIRAFDRPQGLLFHRKAVFRQQRAEDLRCCWWRQYPDRASSPPRPEMPQKV